MLNDPFISTLNGTFFLLFFLFLLLCRSFDLWNFSFEFNISALVWYRSRDNFLYRLSLVSLNLFLYFGFVCPQFFWIIKLVEFIPNESFAFQIIFSSIIFVVLFTWIVLYFEFILSFILIFVCICWFICFFDFSNRF